MPDILTISDGDRAITGRFTYRSRRSIQVEISSGIYPFRAMVTMYVPESKSPGGLLGAQGIASGENILRMLDKLCRFIEENRSTLVASYREFSGLVKQLEGVIGLSDFMFEMTCKSLDKERETGAIGQAKYEQELADAQERNGRYHRGLAAIRKEFFSQVFPFRIPPDVEDQILTWLGWEDVDGQSAFITIRK